MKSISGLYLVTYNYNKPNLLNIIEDSLNGGVDIVEYMDTSGKNIDYGKKIRKLCDDYGKKLTVFNDISLMDNINADGIHFASNTEIEKIREYRSKYKNKIFGISVHCSREMALKYQDYVDYISTGLCFKSESNKNAEICCLDLLKNMDGIHVPVFAVGGINDKNIDEILRYPVSGVVVVSYIMNSSNPKMAAKKLKEKLKLAGL
ncbi:MULTISPECIES: thiamine phosphate synthase [Acidiplasma]|jgi:thiamine-phosphate pyrophosphorylase|uniref:Thiamine phosphate synthase/TenI domain-containing protein n=2 Tax=Acidiplasma TaxID=507753 RepID=A0A0Q0RWV9_9ARCH|nr:MULTISPECIES: thiamine phosphate synthase [Acidiplasma]KJE49559.1 hypothetical protein TZ01_00005 [Acidiplasma sp. MBA-1]KPV44979.1 hypothetical protein SE19_08475 [Acidiplasma aeolicum]KQB34051.1 hypothetical protein AOG54_05810 [Acidiplasma aeolicum]KQB34384.1 hypothetical protein AOG55_00135 [Acidiplasma cupricumulans]WMT54169.1 MAG: thiamine phosphate synthase [Acidiplasma sp.]